MNIQAVFDTYEDEFLKFDRVQNKLSSRPDIHAFILLNSVFPESGDMVTGAGHDIIYLDVDAEKAGEDLTEAQLIDLHRCGVILDEETDSLAMFV